MKNSPLPRAGDEAIGQIRVSTASPFNPRVVIGMIVAGILAFGALLLLLAFGSNIGAARDGRGHALSVSAVGYKALFTLVGSVGDARMIRSADDLATEDLVVVAIEPQTRPEAVAEMIEARSSRPTLFILPKWMTAPDPDRGGWVRAVFAGAGNDAAQSLGGGIVMEGGPTNGSPRIATGTDILDGLQVPIPASPQRVSGKALTTLVPIGFDGSIVARIGDQPHYVVADPDLLNNQGLDDPATARAALALIDALNPTGARGVGFDLTLNGLGDTGNPSLLRLAFEPPFLAMTLALLAAALLAGIHGAYRFGPVAPARRTIAFGKAALVENSAGLIRLAGREARLGPAYADVVRHEAARALNAPPALQGSELDAYLDRLSRAAMPRGDGDRRAFSELAGELAGASDRHRLMTAARALARWKRQVAR